MKKKKYWIIGIIILVLVLVFVVVLRGFTGEDSWIKNEKGEYVKHGNPYSTPDYVKEQQDAILCARNLYSKAKSSGMTISSQCLGNCGDYAVDIVHVPRNSEDNIAENQCSDYINGITKHFVEIDSNGEIVRIV